MPLGELDALAQTFDAISAPVGQTYPAREFVRWLGFEVGAAALLQRDRLRPTEADEDARGPRANP